MSTSIHNHPSSSSRAPATNHSIQKAQRRSRSRTRSKDGSSLLTSNLAFNSNEHAAAYHCQQQQHSQHNLTSIHSHESSNKGINTTGADQACQNISDSSKNEPQSTLDISKRVVNRVESLRQFLLHGKLSNNQQEPTLTSNACAPVHGDGSPDPNNITAHSSPQHHGFVGSTAALHNAGNHAQPHSQCSCRPSVKGGLPAQGFVAHRQAAFLAATNGAVGNHNPFHPGMAHARRRSKSSERLGGGGPPRLSIAATPAFISTALPNGPHPPQLFAPPPFLFATFNPQEVVR